MERLGDIVARVLANVRDTMEEEKARAGLTPAREVAARQRGGGESARVKAHNGTPTARSQKAAATKAIGVMRR